CLRSLSELRHLLAFPTRTLFRSLAAEPMYSEVDYLQGDQQNTGQGDFIPDPEKMSKFSTKMTDFQFLENGDIRFIYKDRFLITIDRKSTRLNSSHVKISYAVFCL